MKHDIAKFNPIVYVPTEQVLLVLANTFWYLLCPCNSMEGTFCKGGVMYYNIDMRAKMDDKGSEANWTLYC